MIRAAFLCSLFEGLCFAKHILLRFPTIMPKWDLVGYC